MNVVAITVISVVGTALFGMFFMQFQGLREDMREGFRAVNGDIRALDHKFTVEFKAVYDVLRNHGERIDRVFDVLREHGERLARIEAKLEIDPPAEAA
jgi:hypothetical protein